MVDKFDSYPPVEQSMHSVDRQHGQPDSICAAAQDCYAPGNHVNARSQWIQLQDPVTLQMNADDQYAFKHLNTADYSQFVTETRELSLYMIFHGGRLPSDLKDYPLHQAVEAERANQESENPVLSCERPFKPHARHDDDDEHGFLYNLFFKKVDWELLDGPLRKRDT